MAINRIRLSNFKSFKNLDVELGKFNVLIGANASGKSNFLRIFEFVRDITNYGLNNAISMQGGIDYIGNINVGKSENFSLEIFSNQELKFAVKTKEKKENKLIGVKVYEIIYKFSLKFAKRGSNFKIVNDTLKLKCDFVRLDEKKKESEIENLGKVEIIISRYSKGITLEIEKPDSVYMEEDDIIPQFMKDVILPSSLKEIDGQKTSKKDLIIQPPYSYIPVPWADVFSDISIYDFEPKLSKKATQITGKAELEEDGKNLAIILKNILDDEDKERKLSNLIRDILPFVAKLDVEKFADKSLLFKLREIYSKKQYLPGSLLSDGTVNIIALIIALYFEKKPIIIIEEPERNIHPYLISKLVNMMKDASKERQIIVTTHNPEVIRHAGLENIYLVSRNKEGFSTISKPSEKEEVKIFLENEMGIEELYVQNLLEI